MKDEWISVKSGIPSDRKRCWINTKLWGVMDATFYWKDSFDRPNYFIKQDGGHINIEEVTHYMEMEIPSPPNQGP